MARSQDLNVVAARALSSLIMAWLVIECLDELVYGAREAAWPLIRQDLALTYAQIGVLLSLPSLTGQFIEPVIGIQADRGYRRALILGGGVVFAGALALVIVSQGFWPLLIAFVVLYPASGAFVSLSQAAMMDAAPDRREQNMARWALAGSIGVVVGPLALGAASFLGIGWRGLFAGFALLTGALLVGLWRAPLDGRLAGAGDAPTPDTPPTFRQGVQGAVAALRQREVLRWLALLGLSDLMLDVLLGFLALYFADVVGLGVTEAGLAVAVWTGVGLAGDALLIPLLERVRGLTYLRFSALALLVLYPAFLLIPAVGVKLLLVGLLGLLNAGWYAILQAQLYATLPEQSGTVMAVGNVSGLLASLIALTVGVVAQRFGLGVAMWLLLAGPVALLIGIPRGVTQAVQA